MRRLFVILAILLLILAAGCAKQEEPTETDQQVTVPELGQVEPEAEEEVTPPAEEPTVVEQPTIDEPVLIEEEPYEEYEETEELEEIKLNPDKTMSLTEKTVTVGTTLKWKNYDTWPHILVVETGKGFETIRHARSDRLNESATWEYAFNEPGTFLVRDMFSGPMRMTVTVT